MCARVGSVNGPLKWPLAEGGHCVNVADNLLQVRLGLTGSVHGDTWICHPVQNGKWACNLQFLWVFAENT